MPCPDSAGDGEKKGDRRLIAKWMLTLCKINGDANDGIPSCLYTTAYYRILTI